MWRWSRGAFTQCLSTWIGDAVLWLRVIGVSAYLIGGGIILALVGGIWVLAWASGRRSERQAGLVKVNKVREKQLDAATNAPKTKDEIIDRLRKTGL